MVGLKTVADFLTWFRFALGPGLVVLGATGGAGSLSTAAAMVLVGWAADASDGALARRDPQRRQTWIGEHDLLVDVVFSVGVWLYLTICGWIKPAVALIYLGLVLYALWQTRSEQLAWGVQGLPYLAMGIVTLRTLPRIGWLFVLYVVGIVAITWPRIPRRTMIFLRGMRALITGDAPPKTDTPDSSHSQE